VGLRHDDVSFSALLAELARPRATASELRDCLGIVHRFLARGSTNDLLAAICSRPKIRSGLESLLGRPEHVGFIAPPGLSQADVAEAATATSFSLDHKFFASVMVAAELGELVSRPKVPTTIFRGTAAVEANRDGHVEIFMPDYDPAVVHEWTSERVVMHVAVTLEREGAFEEAISLFAEIGFTVPSFFEERPWVLPLRHNRTLRTVYVDGRHEDRRCRIEVLTIT
jgi:hypothetical protein